MFQFETNEAVVIEQKEVLEAALSSSPEMQRALRKVIRQYILDARAEVVRGIKFKGGDPRGTAQAVRTSVYKKIFGANINIYNTRKSKGGGSPYEPPRHPSPRGGNRRTRSDKTTRMMSYPGPQRGMILRWLNDGTEARYAFNGRNGETEAERVRFIMRTGGKGYRGSLAARNFFRPLSDRALDRMRDNLNAALEQELADILNKKK